MRVGAVHVYREDLGDLVLLPLRLYAGSDVCECLVLFDHLGIHESVVIGLSVASIIYKNAERVA